MATLRAAVERRFSKKQDIYASAAATVAAAAAAAAAAAVTYAGAVADAAESHPGRSSRA